MGTPVKTQRLSDGDTVAEWAQNGPPGDNVVSFTSNQAMQDNASPASSPAPDEKAFPDKSYNQVLALTFDTNNVLVAWQMNY